ncbi:MAG: 50S ribosomal protein L5 [Candidatus Babeliales bacterium]
MEKARLQELYTQTIRPKLQNTLGLKNVMEVPKIEKIVLNIGVKDAVQDSKSVDMANDILTKIAGQKAVKTRARKSIAGFKLREGMPIGTKVTLRGRNMYEFFDRLISVALPAVRDFQGLKLTFDHRGNYNLGIKEWVVFPEIDYDTARKVYGMNITIHTSTDNDAQAYELLKAFGMPFKQAPKKA